MTEEPRFTPDELMRLSKAGVNKVDLLGPEGTAKCSSDEVEAMASLLFLLGILDGRISVIAESDEHTEGKRKHS